MVLMPGAGRGDTLLFWQVPSAANAAGQGNTLGKLLQ